MGKDSATQLASFLSDEELKQVIDAAHGLPPLSFQAIDQLVKEFGKNYVTYGLTAHSADLSQLLNKQPLETDTSTNAIGNKPQNADSSGLDSDIIKLFFQTESPKIGALLLGALDDELAAKVLADLDPDLRNALFQAFLNRKKVDENLLRLLEGDLYDLIANTKPDEGNTKDIEKSANLINQFPANISDSLVEYLEGSSPEHAAAIKKSLFKFTSIELLSKEHRSVLFDSVQTDEIVKALADASDSLKESVFEILSQRNRRLVESEMARAIPNPEDTEKVQKAISVLALNLAKAGKIVLPEAD
jgi:flagellar motor switch protein FliG